MPGPRNPQRDEPISLHPLDPEAVLRALMGVVDDDAANENATVADDREMKDQ